jgi:hypothetical protein
MHSMMATASAKTSFLARTGATEGVSAALKFSTLSALVGIA